MERIPTGCSSLMTLLAGPADSGPQEGAPFPHHDQRGRDKNQVSLQMVSACSACLLQRTCPPWSVHPWVVLTPPHHMVIVPHRISRPLTFPTGSCFLLFEALLPLTTQAEGTRNSSPEQTVSLDQCYSSLGDPGFQ